MSPRLHASSLAAFATFATFATFASAAPAALPSRAQVLQPGLWEMTTKMSSNQGSTPQQQQFEHMQQEMAGMDPAQRAMMQDMMAKQGMIIADGSTRMKVCLTAELAQRFSPFHQERNCVTNYAPVAAGTFKFSQTCSNPQRSSEGQITYSGNTGYSARMRGTSGGSDTPQVVSVEASGRWLGADCGGVVPIKLPAAQ